MKQLLAKTGPWPLNPSIRPTSRRPLTPIVMAALGGLLLGAGNAWGQTDSTPTPAPPPSAAAATVKLQVPLMAGSLAFASPPFGFEVGPFGKWYVDGVLSGLGLVQSSPTTNDTTGLADLSNAQVIVQKIDGIVQFYAQLGAYSIPQLGTQYRHLTDAGDALGKYFSVLPQAFLRIVPSDRLSIVAGKLPTVIGPEYTFDFENFSIERGLLWSQEPAVSRGVQVNYAAGPVTLNLSFNDGYYSNRYNWVSGAATWVITPVHKIIFAAGANFGETRTSTAATPIAQNNSTIYTLAYTYAEEKLTITPYLQYSHVAKHPELAIKHPASSYGGAVLANFNITPEIALAGRAEYISTSGGVSQADQTNLLYGSGSGALSLTLTPTYTYQHLFARADLSIVSVTSAVAGDAFGRGGNAHTQLRGILETGIVY